MYLYCTLSKNLRHFFNFHWIAKKKNFKNHNHFEARGQFSLAFDYQCEENGFIDKLFLLYI